LTIKPVKQAPPSKLTRAAVERLVELVTADVQLRPVRSSTVSHNVCELPQGYFVKV